MAEGQLAETTVDFANILLSGPCNQRCPYCIGRQMPAHLNRSNLALFPLRNLDAFADQLRRHRVRQVVLTGTNTDPQLYRHERELVGWLKSQLPGVQLSLHTNGQLALARMDVWNRYDKATVSIPSLDQATFQAMTGTSRMPDLAAILRASAIPVKVSCVIDEPNIGGIDEFLDHCHAIGVRRLVLRQLWGNSYRWTAPPYLSFVGRYRGNPVYDFRGMEVTHWDFESTTSTSLNLFSDGSISAEYLLAGRALLREPGNVR